MLDIKISGFYDEFDGSLDEQIACIKRLGETYLCPRNLDGRSIASYTHQEFVAEIKPKLVQNGIRFSSIGSPIGKIGIDDEEGFLRQQKQLEELCKIANEMECRYIRVFSFFVGGNYDGARAKVLEKLTVFLNIAKRYGVMLLHENEKKIFGDAPERCLDIYNTLQHESLGLIYDASNFIQCKQDPWTAYQMLKEVVCYYHIKDCDKNSRIEVPLGVGDGQYAALFADLSARGYQGFFTMEPHTFRYAKTRQMLYFTPLLPLFMQKSFRTARRVDKALGLKATKGIGRHDIFLVQYQNLKEMTKSL